MASQIFDFEAASEDLSTFQVVNIDPTDGAYANAASGHNAVKFDALVPDMGESVSFAVAFADCDTNKQNEIIGVSKYVTYSGTSGSRRSGLDNSSGLYLVDLVDAGGAPFIVRTAGVGPCIDARSSPRSGIKRIMLVGFTSTDLPSIIHTVLVATPTKIV